MQKERLQQIKELLEHEMQKQDPNTKIRVQRTSLGWLRLYIVTSLFNKKNLMEREQSVDSILEDINLNLGGYPFANYELQTPEEAMLEGIPSPIQVPLWSEILMAPESDEPIPLDEDTNKRPFIVTFYSFKGGVGRSTALAFVATILANRNRRVVMIDFDLEAPGLSFMFPSEQNDTNTYGVLDYIYQRYLTPDINEPKIVECIRQIDISTRGELYLVPAGAYDENYIHRLADLDIRSLYQQEVNPLHQLLKEVKDYLEPDVILIDARTGFTEMGAVALLDQADLGILCFSPTSQSLAGLQWVVKAASKQRSYQGIPDLRFLLTPIPAVAQSQQQIWLADTTDWIANNWVIPPSLTIEELYYQIPYNPVITTLTNLSTATIPGLLETYMPVADTITASLPEKTPVVPKLADVRQKILSELNFRAATAQELALEDIPDIFQRTEDFTKFLQDRTWLVRGAKGTGKTLLFRLFVERPESARTIATSNADLSNVQFIPGHGRSGIRPTLLTSTDLGSYELQAGTDAWPLFWLNYMLLQLVAASPKLQNLPLDPQLIKLSVQKEALHSNIITWLVSRAKSPQAAPQANDELQMINHQLQQIQQKVWLLYDELDVGFGQDYARRRRALEGLIGWWVEIGPDLSNIIPKILLREDIWSSLNFTNKAYFSSRVIHLRWEEADLWRLVLRQALGSSSTLAELVRQQFSASINSLDIIQIEQLHSSLFPLWGERMGRGNKAYTYNWVRNRISDSKNNRFPRSLIQLLQLATNNEKTYSDRNQYEAILRPRALIDALPSVSEQRVAEIRNEYSDLADPLDKLANERSPIALDRLGKIWDWDKDSKELKQLVTEMIDAGILQEYPRSDPEAPRYSIADLYLYGLKMQRLGQR